MFRPSSRPSLFPFLPLFFRFVYLYIRSTNNCKGQVPSAAIRHHQEQVESHGRRRSDPHSKWTADLCQAKREGAVGGFAGEGYRQVSHALYHVTVKYSAGPQPFPTFE